MNNQPEQNKEISAEQFLKSKKLLVPIDYMLPLSTTFPGNIKIVDLLTEYKEALSLPQQSDSVEFADWIKDNFKRIYPIKATSAIWFPLANKLKIDRKRYTTTELYKLFKDGK